MEKTNFWEFQEMKKYFFLENFLIFNKLILRLISEIFEKISKNDSEISEFQKSHIFNYSNSVFLFFLETSEIN